MNSKEFSKFFRDNISNIYRFIFLKVSSKDLAEDLTSETFLRLWRYASDNKDKGGIKDVRALAYRIARNLVIDHYRSKDRQPLSLEGQNIEPSVSLAGQGLSPEYRLAVKQELGQVRQALSGLRPEHADAVVMHYLDEFSIREISRILGESEGTIRVWLHRGLQELREKLDKT